MKGIDMDSTENNGSNNFPSGTQNIMMSVLMDYTKSELT